MELSDLSNFNGNDLILIYGEYPACIHCKNRAWEFHHICRRGNKKDRVSRKIHSSVFNAAPLCRTRHDGKLHDKETREEFLCKVYKQVIESSYELDSYDALFLAKYAEYYFTKE